MKAEEPDMYAKARAMGLDDAQVAMARRDPGRDAGMQQMQLEAHARVAIHALAYDQPGQPVCIDRYGIGISYGEDGAMYVWRRTVEAGGLFVKPEVFRRWYQSPDS
jgi:hypothetical protein